MSSTDSANAISSVYSIAFTPLLITYTFEILPDKFCPKGYNIFVLSVEVTMIINKYTNPIALNHWGWKCYVCLI